MIAVSDRNEWLEADGLGGFASGTAGGVRTRRYHALLLSAATPPTGRMVLVNGVDAWVDSAAGSSALSSQRYEPGVVHPDGATRITAFSTDPWPSWTFTLRDGTTIEQSIVVPRGRPVVSVRWRLLERPANAGPVTLRVRVFLSGRDYHSLHHENGDFNFVPQREGLSLLWRPYHGVPGVELLTNGAYAHAPEWYRNFRYEEELARGLDGTEDLASPGVLTFDLRGADAELVFAAASDGEGPLAKAMDARAYAQALRDGELMRRRAFPSRLHRAADAYLVSRREGTTVVAGYPWFTDWGRDTFIALRGLCLASGRVDEARQILLEWAGALSEGMLPNRFTDRGEAPEFNAVDASLWFVIVVYELFEAAAQRGVRISKRDRAALEAAVDAILAGYAGGTRFGIRLDADGLLAAGAPGVQLTWMDAKVGDWVVTPRIGKPVEVEALWLNALWLVSQRSRRWLEVYQRGRQSFCERFWNERTGALNDVVDVNHEPGVVDAAFRPNQVLALGGLPLALVDGARARRAVDALEQRLWTPLGLRSLAPGEPGYTGRYAGGVRERDGAYHQGTVWPWLLTPFVEAWVRARGGQLDARQEARTRFLAPLLEHLDDAGIDHVSEVADGDAPHRPGGCPFQAWSVGEALRLDRVVLATSNVAVSL